MHDKPVVDELVLCIMDNILGITDGWIGSAELVFPEAHGEELDMLGLDQGGTRLSSCILLFGFQQRDIGGFWLSPGSFFVTRRNWQRVIEGRHRKNRQAGASR